MATAFILGSGIANFITAVRADLGDDGSTLTYTNAQLIEIIKKSIRDINMLIGTAFYYYPTPSGIAPLPTEAQGSLIIAYSECLIARRAQKAAVRKGIRVRSGEESIDTTAAFGGYSQMVKDDCDRFNKLFAKYMDTAAGGGAAEHGDLYWHGNQRIYEDEDHDGQESHTRWYDSPFDENV